MFLLKQILPALILAMLVAAPIAAAASFWRNEKVRRALVPLALGLGYFSGHLYITGWTPFPPADTTNWLPHFALGAAAIGALFPLMTWAPTRTLLHGLVCVGALRLLLEPKFRYGWSVAQGWMWIGCLSLAIVLVAITLNKLARRASMAVELPVLLLILCGGTAGALVLSGSLLLSQFATVLAAAVLGTGVLALRGLSGSEGIAPVFSLLVVALLLSGYFFAELPATSAALLVFSPAFALIPLGTSVNLRGLIARVALISAPVGLALFLAFRSSPSLEY